MILGGFPIAPQTPFGIIAVVIASTAFIRQWQRL